MVDERADDGADDATDARAAARAKAELGDDEWTAITRRNARSVQTTIGWIFWDPGAVQRYETLGLPGPLGYIAARCAPLGPAGASAVVAAFGSISPFGIGLAIDLVAQRTSFAAVWQARNEAVLEGLGQYAPSIVDPLVELGPALWPVVEQLPKVGKVFFAAHLDMPRPDDPLLSGWHAVNCLREYRGDVHWALVAANGLSGPEASVLHNEWLRYESNWLPTSRGSTPEETAAAWQSLVARGLMHDGRITDAGIELRQHLEDETDRLTSLAWRLLGREQAIRFAEEFEPGAELLLRRVDETAGSNYQPASRIHGHLPS